MKKSLLLYAFFFLFFAEATIQSAAQSSGIYESYAILSLNGAANTYYDLQATTGNPDFNGTNLGMFRAGTSQLVLNGGQNKTYKNGGCDITNGVLQYRIYPTAGVPGSFSPLNMSFLCEYPTAGCGSNSGDQVWEVANGSVNVLNTLTPGNYTLEVYTSANYQGCGTGTHYTNNSGVNYKATFTVYTDFITTWKTDNSGTSSSTSITIPTTGTGYNYDVDWNNDGVYDELGLTTNVTHDFGTAGTYTIRIRGSFPRIYFNNGGDKSKLLSITQWGSIAWTSMSRAFFGCNNLTITSTDIPNLSGVTDMSLMFHSCSSLNGPSNIDSWDISTITNLSATFAYCSIFNQPLNNWNTAAVTSMSNTFNSALAFNQLIGNWNTTAVTNMEAMFQSAYAFNKDIGNFNTSNVTTMYTMFNGATSFNQPIGSWNTGNVTTMFAMFQGASAFNQSIANWNTSKVTSMEQLFYGASSFNQPIGSWNTGAVTTMRFMFYNALSFNQTIGNWNTSAVTNMNYMFYNAASFNQPVGNWNTTGVTNMISMFQNATVFNQNLGTWILNSSVSMGNMLSLSGMDCSHYSATLMGWNANLLTPNGRSLGAVGRQYSTVADAARTNLISVKGWAITGDAASGSNCDPGAFISTWKTDNLSTGSSNSTSITIPTTGGGYNYDVDWNNDGVYDELGVTGNVTHDYGVAGTYTIRIRGSFPRVFFNNSGDRLKLLDISQWGNSAWTSMVNAFYGCRNLNITTSDIPNLSGVTDMSAMFADCYVLNGPANIGSWNTSAVTIMAGLFSSALAFNQPIGGWNTGAVTNMSGMFYKATAFNQPIGNWNTAAVRYMNNMFWRASAFNQPIGNWNTASVTTMNQMFYETPAFNQPLNNWNVTAVTDMTYMFGSATSFNQPLNSWNVSFVQQMGSMFSGASSFNQNLGNWVFKSDANIWFMLSYCGMDCSSYSASLIGWSKNPSTPNGRSIAANLVKYNYTGLAAKEYLVNNKGWYIQDAGNGATFFLGGTSGTQVCQNKEIGIGKMFTDGCNTLVMVTPNGASPVSGNINTCVTVDAAIQYANGQLYLQRHFDITPESNPTTSTARITLYVLQSEFDAFNAARGIFPALPTGAADAAGIANLRITQLSGTGTAPGNYVPGTRTLIDPDDADILWNGYHWEISFNVTGFSGFYIHTLIYNAPLPVSLLSFSGYKSGSVNKLNWTTVSEQNNRGFSVERSADGVNYTAIGFVNSLAVNGNSDASLTYSFSDANPTGSKQYYRLRQQDVNGGSRLSNVIVIKGEKATALTIDGLYPNPVSSQLNVALSSPVRGTVTLQVVDMTGRILSQQVKAIAEGSNTVSVKVAGLSNGSYILKVVNAETGAVSAKFSKQ